MNARLREGFARITTKLSAWDGKWALLSILAFAAAIGVGAYALRTSTTEPDRHGEIYTLVPERVSASAAIAVTLPEELALPGFEPSLAISFTPAIEGKWDAENAEGRVYRFLPDSALPVGAHYLATLETDTLRMEKMFSVEKDPTVLAVFPKGETEASEYSRITVMFSRPMVPLSTLDETADVSVPIKVTPATEGRWKWITTRTLAFIPSERLVRSANYRIEVMGGLASEDGVAIPAFVHTFHTRRLAYAGAFPFGTISLPHDAPLRVYFDQPVDLEAMREMISVTASGTEIATSISYGTREEEDGAGKLRTLGDRSIIEIYPLRDSLGRAWLWDFDVGLTLTVRGAKGVEGDILLDESRTTSYRVARIVESVSASSDRSNAVSPELFDPTGKLVIRLGEEIDLSRSKIDGKGIRGISWGEKCRELAPGEEIPYQGSDCPKEEDRATLLVSFDPSLFAKGERSLVVLRKLVNVSGVTLSPEAITIPFTTYPEFEILSSIPAKGAMKASLTDLLLCSNSPIAEPPEEDFYARVRANMMLGKWGWGGSFFVSEPPYGGAPHCPFGTWETRIRYGLVPNYAYALDLSLDDHFGQHAPLALAFTTADADPLAKRIEPLQNEVLMATPDRTKLTFGLDFMSAIDVTVCRVSAETMLRLRVEPLSGRAGPGSVSCESRVEKHVVLPEGYATRKYVEVDLADYTKDLRGDYVVFLTHPGYREANYYWQGGKSGYELGAQLYHKTYLSVTDLSVGMKLMERSEYSYGYSPGEDEKTLRLFMEGKWPANLVWVTNARTLAGEDGAKVTEYAREENGTLRALPSRMTGEDGIASLPSAANIVGAIVEKGGERAVVTSRTDALSYAGWGYPARREYVYTDRPIYRPGDTVHVKGISRIGYDARYENASGKTVIELRDAEYQVARSVPVTFTKNGTYETEFVLAKEAPLGTYAIRSDTGGWTSFAVEEYVAPDFRVAVGTDNEEYVSGDAANFSIDAAYYFGVPLESADVEYRVVAQDYYFDRYKDEYFEFSSGWYSHDGGWYGDRYITSGKARLGKDGKASVPLALDIDALFSGDYRASSKLVTLRATVKGPSGRSVTSERSVILHRASFYAGLVSDSYFYRAGETGTMRVKTVDVKGSPVSADDLAVTMNKVEWKSYKRQEVDGDFYYRTERVLTEVSSKRVSTDAKGDGRFSFTIEEAGEYEARLVGKDERGNPVSASYAIYIAGAGNAALRPTNNATLELASERTSLSVGDTASFVIKSPKERAKALVTILRGDIFEKKVIDIHSSLTEYRFQIDERYVPNVSAQVLLLTPSPEVKYGEIDFTVGAKEKELSIDVRANKANYLPGEEVVLSVLVKDSRGAPSPGEISLAVVDESVLALVGNPKKNPVTFFYGGEPVVFRTLSNVKNVLTVAEVPTGTKGGSGGGGDDLEKKKRGVFRDTALWQGTVPVDEKGRAEIRFTLPDNLTSWQIEGIALGEGTKVGAGYATFVSRKPLMATPLLPRFILPGDRFSVGATVFNESDERAKIAVAVDSSTLEFTGAKNASITLEPHSSLSLTFPVTAPLGRDRGEHAFTIVAKSADHEDTVSASFPIERSETYESTVTAGRVDDDSWKERLFLPKGVVPDRGGLTISLSATMASIMNDAIEGMMLYPYECSEQVAGKLRTIALVTENDELFGTSTPILTRYQEDGGRLRLTVREVVAMGLAKLYGAQGSDGGVAFYPGMPSDFWLTRAVLEAYLDLRDAGFAVDDEKIRGAARYVYNSVMYPSSPYTVIGPDQTIASAYVLERLGDPSMRKGLDERIAEYAKDRDLIERELGTPALAYLAVLAKRHDLGMLTVNRLFTEFENRSAIDARGSVVRSEVGRGYGYFEDEIADTALALKAFSEAKRESPLLEGYLRTLKSARGRTGGWSSTYSSITVIDALTRYLSWKEEASAKLSVDAALDGAPLLRGAWDKGGVTRVFATTVPMSALSVGKSQTVTFAKTDLGKNEDAYYYDMSLRYYLPVGEIAPRDEGFAVTRTLYRSDDPNGERPVEDAVQGEVLRVRLTIKTPITREKVGVEDFIPAGLEVVNQRLATEDSSLGTEVPSRENEWYGGSEGRALPKERSWLASLSSLFGKDASVGPKEKVDGEVPDDEYGGRREYEARLYPTRVESHDDRMFAFVSELAPGEYVYDYYVRALVPGTYQHLPAVVSELYTPENFGRTAGGSFTVNEKQD